MRSIALLHKGILQSFYTASRFQSAIPPRWIMSLTSYRAAPPRVPVHLHHAVNRAPPQGDSTILLHCLSISISDPAALDYEPDELPGCSTPRSSPPPSCGQSRSSTRGFYNPFTLPLDFNQRSRRAGL